MGIHDKHTGWDFKDLVRFETCRIIDLHEEEEVLEQRDRTIYQNAGNAGHRRSDYFKHWLQQRLLSKQVDFDFSESLEQLFKWIVFILSIVGFSAGIGIALGTLQYDGSVPVNVSVFLGLILLPQVLLLLLHLIVGVLSFLNPEIFHSWTRMPVWLFRHIGSSLWLWTGAWYLKAAHRDHLGLYHRIIQDFFSLHGRFLSIRVYAICQQFGVFFNLGVLLCAGLLLMFSDRAFGWQSSLTSSPEMVYRWVSIMATPWSWFLGDGVGFPSLTNIDGSLIILKDQAAEFLSEDLISWWPFLLLSVAVYGLVPRVSFLGVALICERWFWKKIDFEGASYYALWNRSRSLAIDSSGTDRHPVVDRAESLTDINPSCSRFFHLWISENILSRYEFDDVFSWLNSQTQFQIEGFHRLESGQFPFVVDGMKEPLFLVEGWQPPIVEKLNELHDIAHSKSLNGKDLTILLLGKPGKDRFTHLKKEMIEVWKIKIQQMGMKNVQLLIPEKEDV